MIQNQQRRLHRPPQKSYVRFDYIFGEWVTALAAAFISLHLFHFCLIRFIFQLNTSSLCHCFATGFVTHYD